MFLLVDENVSIFLLQMFYYCPKIHLEDKINSIKLFYIPIAPYVNKKTQNMTL